MEGESLIIPQTLSRGEEKRRQGGETEATAVAKETTLGGLYEEGFREGSGTGGREPTAELVAC